MGLAGRLGICRLVCCWFGTWWRLVRRGGRSERRGRNRERRVWRVLGGMGRPGTVCVDGGLEIVRRRLR